MQESQERRDNFLRVCKSLEETFQSCLYKQFKGMGGTQTFRTYNLGARTWTKNAVFIVERLVTLQSNDLLDVTVLIADQNRYRVWLARGRSLLEQSAWTSAPVLPALKFLLHAETDKLLLLIPASLLYCEQGEL